MKRVLGKKEARNAGILIGRRLKALRLKKEVTQAEIARRLGVNPVTVFRWETGGQSPGVAHLEILAGIYEVELNEILDDQEIPIILSPNEQTIINVYRSLKTGEKSDLVVSVN